MRCPLLDDVRSLVEFADAGSLTAAADRLYRTPSAVTRQVQRLEAALGAELLDRSVKPPRLNSLGFRVLEQARDLLRQAEALKSLASSASEPSGLLRIGVSHALAEAALVDLTREARERYPKVRLRLLSELTGELFDRLLDGTLDMAAVLLPEGRVAPPPLLTLVIASDRMSIIQARGGDIAPAWAGLADVPWVLNPPGCLLRAALVERMEGAGVPAVIAAEIHNMHLQLAFVRAGYGLGMLPARFIRRSGAARSVKALPLPGFDLRMSIAIVRAGPLGALDKAASLIEDRFRHLFGAG